MANYPNTLPSLTNPTSTDFMNVVLHATQHSNANDEIEAIATELGTLAKGAYPTVRDRFEAIEASLATKIGSIVGTPLEFVRYNATADDIEASGYSPSDFAAASHISSSDHDSRYYTEAEADALLASKMELVLAATLDNFASWDGSGQVKDSGLNSASFEAAGSIATAIAAHLATHTISVEHNPFIVGTKEVDETDIADNKVLYFNFEDNTIQYGNAFDVSTEDIQDIVGAMFIAGTGPTTWVYNDGAGTLQVNLPQAVATTSSPQFTGLTITGTANIATLTINSAYTLPAADGANGQVLTTNGAGVVTFQPVSAVTGSTLHHIFALMGA